MKYYTIKENSRYFVLIYTLEKKKRNSEKKIKDFHELKLRNNLLHIRYLT